MIVINLSQSEPWKHENFILFAVMRSHFHSDCLSKWRAYICCTRLSYSTCLYNNQGVGGSSLFFILRISFSFHQLKMTIIMLARKISFISRKVVVLSSFTLLLTLRYLLVLVQNHLQGWEERSDDPACDYGYHRRWCWWYRDGHVQFYGSCIWWNKLSADLEPQFPFLWNIHVRNSSYYFINKLYSA